MLPIKHFIAVLYDRTAVHFEPEYSPYFMSSIVLLPLGYVVGCKPCGVVILE